METHGTPAASQASETGLTTSGVEVVSIRSTLSLLISAFANWLARAGSDCESLSMISTLYFLPPDVRPLAKRLARETEHVRVAFAEAAQRAGSRADEADFDDVAGLRESATTLCRRAPGRRRRRRRA